MIELRKLREQRGLTQSDVAHVLGRTQVWISMVELGKIRPSAEVIERIRAAIERLAEFRATVNQALSSNIPTESEVCKNLRL